MIIYQEDEIERAKQYVLDTQNPMKSKHCPVFKKKCLGLTCMSFYPGTVVKNSLNEVRAYPACCSSPLVTGVINHEE